MKHLTRYTQPAVRFRRWCRKGYAVFSSLGKCVTIGRLSKGIADRSLGKQALCATGVPVAVLGADAPHEEGSEGSVADLLEWESFAQEVLAFGQTELNKSSGQLLPYAYAQLAASVAHGNFVLFLFKLIKDREHAFSRMLPVFFMPICHE